MIPFNIRFSVLLQSINLGMTKVNRESLRNIPPCHYTHTRTHEYIMLILCICMYVCAQSLSGVQLFAVPRTMAHQAPLVH